MGKLDVMFATASGTVRRNKLSDFVQVNRNGKIAMKLEGEDRIVDVRLCMEADDVLLTTRKGRAIRFAATDVRVFRGRNSIGVRGVRLGKDDHVISMAVLHHVSVTTEEARAYLSMRRPCGAPCPGLMNLKRLMKFPSKRARMPRFRPSGLQSSVGRSNSC
nr:DNA gyrase C-terminal beta-propeller domain-containing protein [Hyphobacterium sp. CCMP332]